MKNSRLSATYRRHPGVLSFHNSFILEYFPACGFRFSLAHYPDRCRRRGTHPVPVSCHAAYWSGTTHIPYSISGSQQPPFSLTQLKTVLLKLQKSVISHLTQFVRHCTSVDRQVVRKLLPVKWDLDVRTVLFFRLFGEIREQFFSRCAP